MGYLTIKNEAHSEFEEKKSIFIGHAKRVYTEENAKAFIDEIKFKHKTAKHNVYAYAIGEKLDVQRYTDDGEPQGTAGIPVLEVIKKSGITDVVIVVTRYFGGILLGTGGLVRAYTKAAGMAIKEGQVVLRVKGVPLYITINYDQLGKLQYFCEQKSWYIENIEYTDKVKLTFYCEVTEVGERKTAFLNLNSGNCDLNLGEEAYYFKLEDRLYLE